MKDRILEEIWEVNQKKDRSILKKESYEEFRELFKK